MPDGPVQLNELSVDGAQRLRACCPDPALELPKKIGIAGGQGEVAGISHEFDPIHLGPSGMPTPPAADRCLAAGTALGAFCANRYSRAGLSCLGGTLAHGYGCAGVGALAACCSKASTNLGLISASVGQGLSELLVVFGRPGGRGPSRGKLALSRPRSPNRYVRSPYTSELETFPQVRAVKHAVSGPMQRLGTFGRLLRLNKVNFPSR
jgi:hypothetical protein